MKPEGKRNNDHFELKEDQLRFIALSESAVDSIIIINSSSEIIFWNNSAINLFGYKINEAIGKPLSIIIPTKHETAHLNGVASYLKTNKPKIIGKTIIQI